MYDILKVRKLTEFWPINDSKLIMFNESEGKWTNYRAPLPSDAKNFTQLIRLHFLDYNIFSFFKRDRNKGGCCTHQTQTYLKYGRGYELSPQDYLERLTNFASRNKGLIHVKSVYVPELCMNVIIKLSFGRGVLMFAGGQHGQPLGIYAQSDQRWHIFDKERVTSYLTFNWFKQNVICVEKPILCVRSPWFRSSTIKNKIDKPLNIAHFNLNLFPYVFCWKLCKKCIDSRWKKIFFCG